MHRLNLGAFGHTLFAYLLFAYSLFHSSMAVAEQSRSGQLHSRLSQVQSMHARFVQRTAGSYNEILQASEGQLWLGSGAKFRIETQLPFQQILVSDGSSFWNFDRDLDQVVIAPLAKDIKQVPILLFGNTNDQLSENYTIDFFESEGEENFVLKPRSTDSLFEVLTIGFAEAIPTNINIRDSLGQNTRIDFIDTQINQPVAARQFQFTVPEGMDVIDDR
ncbi:MAG: outer membrane lipoprotein chaperone LolA [Pseudomonadales bacterium]|nr:outer membrane lipoprotein chaperone LolA [Pseudomonadales bacterium]